MKELRMRSNPKDDRGENSPRYKIDAAYSSQNSGHLISPESPILGLYMEKYYLPVATALGDRDPVRRMILHL